MLVILISFLITVVVFFLFCLFPRDSSRSAHVILHKFLIPKTDWRETIIIIIIIGSMTASLGTCKAVITTPPHIFISLTIELVVWRTMTKKQRIFDWWTNEIFWWSHADQVLVCLFIHRWHSALYQDISDQIPFWIIKQIHLTRKWIHIIQLSCRNLTFHLWQDHLVIC